MWKTWSMGEKLSGSCYLCLWVQIVQCFCWVWQDCTNNHKCGAQFHLSPELQSPSKRRLRPSTGARSAVVGPSFTQPPLTPLVMLPSRISLSLRAYLSMLMPDPSVCIRRSVLVIWSFDGLNFVLILMNLLRMHSMLAKNTHQWFKLNINDEKQHMLVLECWLSTCVSLNTSFLCMFSSQHSLAICYTLVWIWTLALVHVTFSGR